MLTPSTFTVMTNEKDIEQRVEPSVSDDTASQELHTVDKGVDESEAIIDLPESEEKRILRKIDYRLLPLLTFLYLVAFVDRSNSEYTFL
jgi:hypothetical protein